MRISRCTWSTDRRPPHRLSGISLPLALSDCEQPRRGFLAVLGRHGARADPMIACWMSPSSLCASSTRRGAFLEAAARAVEHRFDLDQPGGKIGFGHSGFGSPDFDLLPGLGRGDVGVGCRRRQDLQRRRRPCRRCACPGPTPGERMPICASSRPACVEQAGLARRCAAPGRRTGRRSPAAAPRRR